MSEQLRLLAALHQAEALAINGREKVASAGGSRRTVQTRLMGKRPPTVRPLFPLWRTVDHLRTHETYYTWRARAGKGF